MNEQKYEQMVKFNMSMVRYYADKCGTVGLYDAFDCDFKALNLSESDLNLWKLIAAFSGDNGFENFRIVPEQYAEKDFILIKNINMKNTKLQF